MKISTMALAMALAAGMTTAPALSAQQNAPAPATSPASGSQTWTTDQIVTVTVHQAWLLSGKNEATFFEMVTQLAEISAKNRDVTLPTTEAAGRRFGELIKTYAKADTDQLLYAVVDRAVRQITHAQPIPVKSRK